MNSDTEQPGHSSPNPDLKDSDGTRSESPPLKGDLGGCELRNEPNETSRNVRPREGWSLALVSGVILVALLIFYFFDPATAPGFWVCPFHRLTGWYCPGCGGQRALHELLHGNILTALRFNALAVLLFVPAAAYAYVAYALRVLRLARLPGLTLRSGQVLTLVVALTLFGAVRNICGPLP